MTDRLPPSNAAAEKAVLGGVLRWAAALSDAAAVLRVEDFYTHANRVTFAAMLALADAGKPVDVVTVAEGLRRRGLRDEAPPAYLADLWDCEPTGANVAYHARLVKECAVRRGLIHAAAEISRDAYDGCAPAEQLVEAAERAIFSVSDLGISGEAVAAGPATDEAVRYVEAQATGEAASAAVPTGFLDLDDLVGGLHPDELTVVAARPSVGKSALAVNLVRNACVQHGARTLFVSLEMSRLELSLRLLACQSGINSKQLQKGELSGDEWGSLSEAKSTLSRCQFHIDDTPVQRVFRVAAAARRLKAKGGLDLVVLDYLQLVEPESRKEPRQEQVAGISRRLKLLSKELHVPVIAVAQLNRGVEDRQDQRPRLSDLRESGAIEQDSDNVLLLHRPTPEARSMEVIVAKQRNGPTRSVWLTWRPDCMRFENHAPDPNFER